MPAIKKLILIPLIPVVGLMALISMPLLLMAAREFYGYLVNAPFSICEVMHKDRLDEALAHGFDVNAGCCAEHMIGECSVAYPNSTPLIFAAENGDIEASRLLIKFGADQNVASQSGSAIGTAASLGHADIVNLLIEHGPKTSQRDDALRMAVHQGHTPIVMNLLLHEEPQRRIQACNSLACDLVTELQQLQNPLKQSQRKLFMHLIESCIDPNTSCGDERLVTSLGRDDTNAPLIKALITRGASIKAIERNGRSVTDNLKAFWDYDTRPAIKALIETPEERKP